nr:MAG TPA: hypothetical protein [Caudoviricetes sp.]
MNENQCQKYAVLTHAKSLQSAQLSTVCNTARSKSFQRF